MPRKRGRKAFGLPIQLIVFNNELPLLAKTLMGDVPDIAPIFQHGSTPTSTLFLKPNLSVQGKFRLEGKEQHRIYHIQEFRFNYIVGKGNRNFDELIGGRLYPSIVDIKSKNELLQFIANNHPDFSIVPSSEEQEHLNKKYCDAGLKGYPIFDIVYSVDSKPKMSFPISKDQWEAIKDINRDFFWEKIQKFQSFVQGWVTKESDKALSEDTLLWLNRELENVSPILTAYKGSVWERVRDDNVKPSTEEEREQLAKKILGLFDARKVAPVFGYRVYGHFALCCLELFYDMQTDLPVFICKRCSTLRAKTFGSKRQTCSKKQNATCFKEGSNKRQMKHRKK